MLCWNTALIFVLSPCRDAPKCFLFFFSSAFQEKHFCIDMWISETWVHWMFHSKGFLFFPSSQSWQGYRGNNNWEIKNQGNTAYIGNFEKGEHLQRKPISTARLRTNHFDGLYRECEGVNILSCTDQTFRDSGINYLRTLSLLVSWDMSRIISLALVMLVCM